MALSRVCGDEAFRQAHGNRSGRRDPANQAGKARPDAVDGRYAVHGPEIAAELVQAGAIVVEQDARGEGSERAGSANGKDAKILPTRERSDRALVRGLARIQDDLVDHPAIMSAFNAVSLPKVRD